MTFVWRYSVALRMLICQVLKAHLSVHICLLDMLECVDVAIPYPEDR